VVAREWGAQDKIILHKTEKYLLMQAVYYNSTHWFGATVLVDLTLQF